jgi:hypothetical protein
MVIPSHTTRSLTIVSLIDYFTERSTKCASIHEIVVIWIDENKIPQSVVERIGDAIESPANLSSPDKTIPTRLVRATEKSLNQRFRPEIIKTQFMLSMDDEMRIPCPTLEFAYKVSKDFPDRLIGFVPRLHLRTPKGSLYYDFQTGADSYSMILTDSAFINAKWYILSK